MDLGDEDEDDEKVCHHVLYAATILQSVRLSVFLSVCKD